MSEQKQPMAGEWWWLEEVIYIVGYTASGNFIIEFADGKTHLCWPLRACEFETWQHLPDCTGWGWQPNKALREFDVSPGDGWRWLGDDEIVQASDEVFRADEGMFVKPMTRAGKAVTHFASDDYPVRRRLEVPTTRTIKLCSVVYWDRPEAPMSTILTEQELERHRKAWRTMHVVSETTVEVPL